MMYNAQRWGRLSFRFLAPHVVEKASSLREDHDIHFEGLSKSGDLQIVPIDTGLSHRLHVLFVSRVNFFGSGSSSNVRSGERAMIFAFWVSTRATSRMDDQE